MRGAPDGAGLLTRDRPVARKRGRRDDGGNHRAVEIREGHAGCGQRQQDERRRTRVVDRAPERQHIQRQPLHLRDVRMVGGLRQVKRRERKCQRGQGGPDRRNQQVAREQVRRAGGADYRHEDEPVVGGHGPGRARDQRTG